MGFELNLKCVTEAEPVPHKYSWYFKPEHEQQFVTLSHTDEMYRIEKVAVSNAGLYKCSAQNDVGKGANSTEKNVLVFCKYSSLFVFYLHGVIFKPCEISCLTLYHCIRILLHQQEESLAFVFGHFQPLFFFYFFHQKL